MQITDEYVKRILINQNSIEKIALARTRQEAEDLSTKVASRTALSRDLFRVTSYGFVVVFMYTAYLSLHSLRFEYGKADGYSSNPLDRLHNSDPRSRYFLHDNPTAAKQ